MNKLEKIISENIKYLCKERNVTPYKLAKDNDIKPTDLNSRLSNYAQWRIEYIVKIADYFGVPVDNIFGKKDIDNFISSDNISLEEIDILKKQIDKIQTDFTNFMQRVGVKKIKK